MPVTYLTTCLQIYLWKSAGDKSPLETPGASRWDAASAWKMLVAPFGQVLVFVIHSQGILPSLGCSLICRCLLAGLLNGLFCDTWHHSSSVEPGHSPAGLTPVCGSYDKQREAETPALSTTYGMGRASGSSALPRLGPLPCDSEVAEQAALGLLAGQRLGHSQGQRGVAIWCARRSTHSADRVFGT